MLTYKISKFFISTLILMLLLFAPVEGQSQVRFYISQSSGSLKFQKKNDLLFSAGVFGNDKFAIINQYLAQVGYSPRKHLAVSIFHNRYNSINTGYNRNSANEHAISGITIGTYYTIKYQMRRPKKRLPLSAAKYYRILFKFSTGYSNGQTKNNYNGYTEYLTGVEISPSTANLNLQKFYLQGDIHFLTRGNFHLSGIYRLGKVNYYKGVIDGQDFRGNEKIISYILSNRTHSFREICLKAEVKRKSIGIYIKATGGLVKGFQERGVYETSTADAGLTLNLGDIHYFFKSRKNKSKD